jgi:3-isopropylmalate dehydrogenase
MSEKYTIALLPGDGIGPEVVKEAVKVLRSLEKILDLKLTLNEVPVGGAAYESDGTPLPEHTLITAQKAELVAHNGKILIFLYDLSGHFLGYDPT